MSKKDVDAALDKRREHLAGVISKLNASSKKTVVTTADHALNAYIMRRPTGVMSLDIMLKGGFPPGITYLSGPDNVGKSHLMYRAMAMHQKLYGPRSRIAHAAVEHPLDHFFLRSLGVIIAVPDEVIEQYQLQRKEMCLPPFTKEEIKEFKRQVGEFYPMAGTMEEVLDAVLAFVDDEDLRKTENQFGIIGIDSFSVLEPKDSLGRDMDEGAKRAIHASLTTEFYNKLMPKLTSLDGDPIATSFLFAQQVRANSAKASAPPHIAKYLPDFASAGAWSAKHAKALDLMITNGHREKEESASGAKSKDVISKMLKILVAKGKAGVHDGVTAEVEMDFQVPTFIDEYKNMLLEAKRKGLMYETPTTRNKPPLISLQKPGTTDFTAPMPYDEVVALLQSDFQSELALRRSILAANGIACRYVA